ncbi:hypothetical protein BHU72_11935 [Desulfuribacillus stibiiarsenatis]|uniref:Uncharacterized protein n=1 Tax=Desulfuribacillus stibiiarsenatis TaxID=1390249 RepID=A0A1E5L8C3_9FIRM|nr:XtrA/YqaO family protein [Desulfuribacillus stibiiarsenatis]OEH86239.1 hypothetical protein BHU72_11935 [Desulfuribacillus stibiiarsenatis]
MRLSELNIKENLNVLEEMCRNASKPCAIIISNGQAKITELPDFGETVIVTHQAKVKRVKFDEGEEF